MLPNSKHTASSICLPPSEMCWFLCIYWIYWSKGVYAGCTTTTKKKGGGGGNLNPWKIVYAGYMTKKRASESLKNSLCWLHDPRKGIWIPEKLFMLDTWPKKGHLNPYKIVYAGCMTKQKRASESLRNAWWHSETASCQEWQPPPGIGNNEKLTTHASHSACCTKSVNRP